MGKKILHCLSTPYRAIHEEQDDTILWVTQAMRNAGGSIDIFLQGSTVNYLCKSQEAPALQFGSWKQTNPPNIIRDLEKLKAMGAKILFASEDLEALGLQKSEIIDGATEVSKQDVPELFSRYDLIHRF